MGREIRRVPAGWFHPEQECKHRPGCRYPINAPGLCFIPLRKDFKEASDQWVAGFMAHRHTAEPRDPEYFWEYEGPPPEREDFVDYEGSPATWFQVYETVSEGTPVTPSFATQDQLIDYLVKHGDSWRWRQGTGGYTRAQAEKFVKTTEWVPSMTMGPGGVKMGIECVDDFGQKAKEQV